MVATEFGSGAGTASGRCAVLGSPIAHSLSPVLHRAGYDVAGLDWSYDAVEVTEAGLACFLDGLDDSWRGLSLTMPLKRAVVPLLDVVSPRVEQAGAANTVVLDGGRRSGHNTDVPGAVAAVRERHPGPFTRAVVLGGGATATSVILALADLGCREVRLVVRVAGRSRDTLAAVARHPTPPEVRVTGFDVTPAPADILVSTIPAAAQSQHCLLMAAAAPVVFDVVYHPWPTPLTQRARAEDRVVVTGLDLLVHQAAEQFTLMTGVSPPPTGAMRAAGEAAVAARDFGGAAHVHNSPPRTPNRR